MQPTWRIELAQILATSNAFGAITKKGNRRKQIEKRTRDNREIVLYSGFTQLNSLGIRLQSTRDFRENHLKALISTWETDGLSNSTIRTRISIFRTFAGWIGKAGMIRADYNYILKPSPKNRSCEVDMSWSAKGIDALAHIEQIRCFDEHVAMQLRVIYAFRLHVQEAIFFKPHLVDRGTGIQVTRGIRGGKQRTIPIETTAQREVLDDAKTFVGLQAPYRSLAHPRLSMEQSIARFYYVMKVHGITRKQLGVTANGLSHNPNKEIV